MRAALIAGKALINKKAMIKVRKEAFFNKETDRLKAAGRGAGWYSILNKLKEGSGEEWNVTQLDPDKSPEQIASDLATHFSSITSQTTESEPPIIHSNSTSKTLIPQLLETVVAARLKEYKKPNSLVPGDIPSKLTNANTDILSIPLTLIYNSCLSSCLLYTSPSPRDS